MMQLATNAIYGLLYVARYSTQIQINVSHFFSHIHVWNCEAKIFHVDHGKPRKLYVIYEFHFPGLEGHGKSWKI